MLHKRTAIYKPLIGTPRQQVTGGSMLREVAVKYLGEARQALARLDTRAPNLERFSGWCTDYQAPLSFGEGPRVRFSGREQYIISKKHP